MEVKDQHVLLRVSKSDKKNWKSKAIAEDKPLSDWIRSQCNKK